MSFGPDRRGADEASTFVGRERELSELHEALDGPDLVSLVGPPGVGKTRLAAHFARVSDVEAVWCSVASARTVTELEERVARALQIPLDDPESGSAQIVGALEHHGIGLIVLDNF